MVDMEMRNRRIQMFEDTLRFCEREQDLVDRIAASRECSVLWSNLTKVRKEEGYTAKNLFDTKRYHIPCKVMCWNQCALDLVSILTKKNGPRRIGTLLLSSSAYFGGNVLRGEEGLEERFSRCTTLYPCLEEINQQRLCYRSEHDLDDETCVYVRDVVCVRREGRDGERIKRQDWGSSDVIMYTSKNIRRLMSMNRQECSTDVLQETQQEYQQAQHRSLEMMLQMAVQQNVEELVIPISQYVWNGCALEDMMERMKTALQKYTYFFRAVHLVFA